MTDASTSTAPDTDDAISVVFKLTKLIPRLSTSIEAEKLATLNAIERTLKRADMDFVTVAQELATFLTQTLEYVPPTDPAPATAATFTSTHPDFVQPVYSHRAPAGFRPVAPSTYTAPPRANPAPPPRPAYVPFAARPRINVDYKIAIAKIRREAARLKLSRFQQRRLSQIEVELDLGSLNANFAPNQGSTISAFITLDTWIRDLEQIHHIHF